MTAAKQGEDRMTIPAAEFDIILARALSEDEYTALMDIPGAQPWRKNRTRVGCPINAARAIIDECDRLGIPVIDTRQYADSPTDDAVTLDAVIARTIERGAYEWVWNAFACEFQKLAVADIAMRKFVASLWGEPGSGKTLMAALATAASPATRIVVVTLPSLIQQTAAEWRRFLSWDVLEYRPVSRRRESDMDVREFADSRVDGNPCVAIVGWDHLPHIEADIAHFFSRGVPMIVWDEAQEGKNPKRKKFYRGTDNKLYSVDEQSQSAAAGRLALHARYRLATTATSLDNSLKDLWGQLTLVEPHAWGSTATRFLIRYCDAQPGDFGGLKVDGMSRANLDELKYRLQYTVVRIPYEVSHGQLPPKRRQVVRVPVEEQINDTGFGREITAAEKAARDGKAAAVTTAANLRLQQAACRKRPATVRAVLPYLSVGKGKIIVFSGRKKDCEDLAVRFRKEDVDVFLSHGDDSTDERYAVKDAYMKHPGPCVLIGTWQAWGTGFNLDDTDCIVYVQLPYTPKELAQSEGRGDRLSMTRPLMYLYMVAEGTIDERIVDTMLTKLEQVDAVTPGSRLHAFGGVARTLKGIDDIDALTAQMLRNMEADTLEATELEADGY